MNRGTIDAKAQTTLANQIEININDNNSGRYDMVPLTKLLLGR